ncbi:MAG: RNA methyltransferase [Candidatus Kapabacteria bacterium]|nr:RNA methyltransferase [Candidatus Kapabacteria bacterium]
MHVQIKGEAERCRCRQGQGCEGGDVGSSSSKPNQHPDIRNVKKLLHADLVSRRRTEADAATAPRIPVVVVLQNIRSLYNVGSIFRTADAMAIRQLVLTGYTPTPPNDAISKTALGADRTVPWKHVASAAEAVTALRDEGYKVFAVELTDDSRDVSTMNLGDMPMALVLGNEIAGVTDDVLALCDGAFEIPMYGVKHSLNVAVAAGIMMYAAARCATFANTSTTETT